MDRGVCIPYTALLPMLLIGLLWIVSQFAKVGLLHRRARRREGRTIRSVDDDMVNDARTMGWRDDAISHLGTAAAVCGLPYHNELRIPSSSYYYSSSPSRRGRHGKVFG